MKNLDTASQSNSSDKDEFVELFPSLKPKESKDQLAKEICVSFENFSGWWD